VLGTSITDSLLKKTYFGHFCAGEDTETLRPVVKKLESFGVGSIFDYAAEADIEEAEESVLPETDEESRIKVRVFDYEGEKECDARREVFAKCIRAAHAVSETSFAAIKCTALGNPPLLDRMSVAVEELRTLFNKFDEDGNGWVTKEEFQKVWDDFFVDAQDVDEMFAAMDYNHDNTIDYVGWSNALRLEDLHRLTQGCRVRGPLAKAALNEKETALLVKLRERVSSLAKLAADNGVCMMVDAEHTYFQPAIDNLTVTMMREHNKDKAVIFNTYQMYLKGSQERLMQDMDRAREGDYHFACKLVRGAYMHLERQRASQMGYPDPILPDLEATHAAYNGGVTAVLERMAKGEKVELMVATHNQRSVEHTIEEATRLGLGNDAPIYFGQLLGMADHLTFTLGQAGWKAYKYVPFGAVKEVMPYLMRRALENGDMLGGARHEIRMLRREMSRRAFSFGSGR